MMIRGRYRLRILNLKVNSGKQRIFHGVNDESSSCRLENASKDPRGFHMYLAAAVFICTITPPSSCQGALSSGVKLDNSGG